MKMKELGKRSFLCFGRRFQKYIPNEDGQRTSFISLFRYAEATERVLIALGVFGGVVSGTAVPLLMLMYGEFTTLLVERFGDRSFDYIILPIFGGGRDVINGTAEDTADALREDSRAFGLAILAATALDVMGSMLGVACLNYTALRQVSRIRRMFLKSVISKDMTWFDQNAETNFSVNVTEGLNNMQEGMGEKIALFINKISAFVVSIIIALFYGWELTLAILATVPLITISGAIVSKVQTTMVVKEQKALGIANTLAEEVFTSIKTVIAFGGEDKELERYKKKLEASVTSGIKRAIMNGIGMGISWFQIYGAYALGFWYGVELYLTSLEKDDGRYTPQVLFGIVSGAMGLGICVSYWESFILAKGSSAVIFDCLDTPSKIDSFSTSGKQLEKVRGTVEFQGVDFSYPARANVQVLKDLNLKINEGTKVALVGSSGSGKSTVIQLIQRLYDPSKGNVMLDGTNIRDLNVNWYRQQIGIVSQEPQLFATSIYDNIKLGMPQATKNEIEQAARTANAHDFITSLPKGYDTVIGERGTMLSGGQKQRIAIARAILRNPKILLLDEATSALDSSNEKAVQVALDKASEGRTTVIVAHRLSTIKNADLIIVLSEGKFVESGTHKELIKLQGEYYKLQNLQKSSQAGTKEKADENLQNGPRFSLTSNKLLEKELVVGDKEEIEEEFSDEEVQIASFWRILSYSKDEWYAFIPGILATLMVGASTPIFAILFGEIFGALGESSPEAITDGTNWNALMVLLLAATVGIALFIQLYSFGHINVKLSSRLRTLTFNSILHQEPAWFDREENRVGALSAKLSGSVADIQGIAGSGLSLVLQGITSVSIGLVISFFYSWQLTLVTCIALPVLFFGVYYEFYVVQGQNLLEKKVIEGATKIAVEGLSCIRTVAGLGREDTFVQKYSEELKAGEKVMMKKSFLRGFIFGIGQSATFIGYGISLWYGGNLIADGDIHYKNVLKISEALLFGVWILGQSLAFAPSYGKAKLSAGRIFAILDRSSAIKDGTLVSKEKLEPKGRIQYEKVGFAYPTRPETKVLKGLSLNIEPGTSVAFAGASGCGKSTLIQLLLRFYDANEGAIHLDGGDIRQLPTKVLRSYMSLVSQEPVLFDMTIAENIAYGDNSRNVQRDEIIKAAKSSNIHNFITSLPEGYETGLGKGGAQLSGGQKQRIAIARALIRNPRVLLLDEATSALDAASESVVQAALDKAMEGRTTITIGHRLGAISGADLICVLEDGKIVEQGTHDQLLVSKGAYARINLQ